MYIIPYFGHSVFNFRNASLLSDFFRSFELCSRILYSISSFAHVSKFQVDELFVFFFFFFCIHAFRLYFWSIKWFFPSWSISLLFEEGMFWKGHFYFWRRAISEKGFVFSPCSCNFNATCDTELHIINFLFIYHYFWNSSLLLTP